METAALIAYLRAQMDQRGWRSQDLAEAADLPPTTISKLLRNERTPGLATLQKIAIALSVHVRVLLELVGIEVEDSVDFNQHQRRIAHLIEAAPWFAQAADQLLSLSPQDQSAVLTYMEMLAQRNQKD